MDILLGEVIPNNLERLHRMFVWLPISLGEYREHARLVQDCVFTRGQAIIHM